MLLALDLATQTGWASGHLTDEPEWGSVRLPSTDEDIGSFGLAFQNWLEAKIDILSPTWIAFEEPIHPTPGKGGRATTNITTLRKLYLLAGLVEIVAKRRKIKVFEDNVSSIRAYFVGRMRVSKAMKPYPVTLACRARGWEPKTTDEADALALWAYAHAQANPSRSSHLDPLFRRRA